MFLEVAERLRALYPDEVRMLDFIVQRREDLDGAIEVIPVVDGTTLTELVHAFERRTGMEARAESYAGLFPAHFDFGPLGLHYLGLSGDGAKTVLLGCSCGEWVCWPLLARIATTHDAVSWCEIEQPHRKTRDYSAFGPFVFARAPYESALQDLDERVQRDLRRAVPP